MRVSLKFLEATKELEQRLKREKEAERQLLLQRKRALTINSKNDFLENRRNERLLIVQWSLMKYFRAIERI